MRAAPLMLLIAIGLLRPLQGAEVPDAFAAAAIVPADATFYIQVENGASLRRVPAVAAVIAAIERSLEGGEAAAAWSRLTEATAEGGIDLVDAVAAVRCAVAVRQAADGTRSWLLIAEIEPARLAALLAPLDPRRLPPRHDIPVVEVPEHGLVFASLGSTVLIAAADAGLFRDALPNLAGVHGAPTLAASPEVEKARSLAGEGQAPSIWLLARHAAPLGGWSVVVATVSAEGLSLRHAGSFESPPFVRPVPTRPWCVGAFAALEKDAVAVMVEPTEIGLPAQGFVEATLADSILDREARQCLGPRQAIVIGEVEGRAEVDAVDLLVPTFALVLELSSDRDEPTATLERLLDRNLIRVSRGIARLGGGAFELSLPSDRDLEPGVPRSIDLQAAAMGLAPGFPVLRGTSLNWTSVDGPRGRFWVAASHPKQLGATVAALARPGGEADTPPRAWTSCGSIDGARAAEHLRSWAARAEEIGPDAPQEDLVDFRATIDLLASVCASVERCRWSLARPSERTMELDVRLSFPARASEP